MIKLSLQKKKYNSKVVKKIKFLNGVTLIIT